MLGRHCQFRIPQQEMGWGFDDAITEVERGQGEIETWKREMPKPGLK
jgi:hypothetical protein